MNEQLKMDQMKREVMGRVKTVYRIRQLTKPLVIEVALLVLSLGALSFMVSIPHVIANLSLLPALPQYILYLAQAFLKTQFAVQLSLVTMVVLFLLLVRDIALNLKGSLSLNTA